MSEQFQTNPPSPPPLVVARAHPPLPNWLGRRILGPNEQITWVRGPSFNPWWERYATHPVLFLVALGLAFSCLVIIRLVAGTWDQVLFPAILVAGAIPVGSIFVLGISAGYFTRLVVTSSQVVVLQGYELCRRWSIDELPRRLIRYQLMDDGQRSAAIDLDTLQTMLGKQVGQFSESKTILAFAKQLDRIKLRDERFS